jgi:hypothetical protein
VVGLHHNADAPWAKIRIEEPGDLHGQPFLGLGLGCEVRDQAGHFGQPEDAFPGQVADVRCAGEGQHVVLAEGPERDVAGQHQLVITVVVGEGGELERPRGKQFHERAGHPGRCDQAFLPVEVDPERDQEVCGGALRGPQVRGPFSWFKTRHALLAVQLRCGPSGGVQDWVLGHGVPFMSWRRRGNGDAAAHGVRIEDRAQALCAHARDETLNEREVHPADHFGPQLRKPAERAISQPDGATIVAPRLEALLGQRALHGRGAAIGPVPVAEVGAVLPGGVAQRGLRLAGGVTRDRLDKQARRQLVLPQRDRHHELATGSRVNLRRPAGTRPAAARRSSVGGRQQAVLHEFVEVIDGERAADPHRFRGLVPSHGLATAGDKRVQAAAHWVTQAADRGQVRLVL